MMNQNAGFSPETITGDYYFEPDIYSIELTKIFAQTWQYVGHVSMLPSNSTYITRKVAEESIIILKDSNGKIKAFYNVCQHRAHQLLQGEGKLSKVIRCPYHMWGYDDCGSLIIARGTETIEDFDKETINLTPVKLEILCGFIFVNLDSNAESLAKSTNGLEHEIREFVAKPERLTASHQYHIDIKANWKNSVENYCECYHCPNQHPTLSQNALDMDSYRIETCDNYHVHRSSDKNVGYSFDEKDKKPNDFRSFYIWPNTVLETYPGGHLTVFHHVPISPEETRQSFEYYFDPSISEEDQQKIVDFVHVIRLEDIPICESVQKGLHSRGYNKGRLVIDAQRSYFSEHSVYDFQKKVLAALAA